MRRPWVASCVERSDGDAEEPAVHAGERRWERREARLDELEAFLHDESTETLRLRWAEELLRVHGEHLDHRDNMRADELRQRLAREVGRPRPWPLSEIVQRQYLAWARACRDAMRWCADTRREPEAKTAWVELLRAATGASELAGTPPVKAEALEIVHAIEVKGGAPEAATHLDRLRVLVVSAPCRGGREALARALLAGVRADLVSGREGRGYALVQELRVQATRPTASERERTALAHALVVCHGLAEAPERVGIERELQALATRPGADQEQRKAWALAVGQVPRQGRRKPRPPTELLRERAYRSADHEDLTALFDRLEVELVQRERSFHEHLAVLTEMRSLAGRPEADVSLRLRFARRWLDRGFDARRYDYGAVANDRHTCTWARAAARTGDPEAQVLLGTCLSTGRGTRKDLAGARQWYRRAAAAGHDEAEYRLRALGLESLPWLRHRYALIGFIGLAMLVLHFVAQPLQLSGWGIVAYLGVSLATLPLYLGVDALSRWRKGSSEDDPEHADGGFVFGAHVEQFSRKPWRILWVATEDGFVLAPLVWLGITPWTALTAGLIFGLAHYPSFSPRACAIKAIDYTLVALLLLPWCGLWSIVIGHIVWDVALLGLGLWRASEATGDP